MNKEQLEAYRKFKLIGDWLEDFVACRFNRDFVFDGGWIGGFGASLGVTNLEPIRQLCMLVTHDEIADIAIPERHPELVRDAGDAVYRVLDAMFGKAAWRAVEAAGDFYSEEWEEVEAALDKLAPVWHNASELAPAGFYGPSSDTQEILAWAIKCTKAKKGGRRNLQKRLRKDPNLWGQAKGPGEYHLYFREERQFKKAEKALELHRATQPGRKQRKMSAQPIA